MRLPSEAECRDLQEELVDAMESIRVASSGKTILKEPPIHIQSGGYSSFDPCSLVRSPLAILQNSLKLILLLQNQPKVDSRN